MKVLLLFVAMSTLVVTSSAAFSDLDSIAGYWGSIKGGYGSNYAQRFACTASTTSTAVTCTGISIPGGTYPVTQQAIEPVIAVGQRISQPGVSFPTWQLDFSGASGGTYILVAYDANTIVNFVQGEEIPNNIPSDLSGYFVWKLIAK